jgi:hypothetical protein
MKGFEGEAFVSPLEQLSAALAKLADTGDDIELRTALTLCRGFADRIIRDRDIEGSLAERLLNRRGRLN